MSPRIFSLSFSCAFADKRRLLGNSVSISRSVAGGFVTTVFFLLPRIVFLAAFLAVAFFFTAFVATFFLAAFLTVFFAAEGFSALATFLAVFLAAFLAGAAFFLLFADAFLATVFLTAVF